MLPRGWMQADCSPGWGDSPSSPLVPLVTLSLHLSGLPAETLPLRCRQSAPRLELPPGKPCLFSDRLGPYEISFLINPRGSNAPEMQGRINWLSVAAFHLPQVPFAAPHNSPLWWDFYSSDLVNTLFGPSKVSANTKQVSDKVSRVGKCNSVATQAYSFAFISEA